MNITPTLCQTVTEHITRAKSVSWMRQRLHKIMTPNRYVCCWVDVWPCREFTKWPGQHEQHVEGEVANLLEQMLSLGFTGGSEWLLTEGQCPHLSEASSKTPIFPDVSLDMWTTRKKNFRLQFSAAATSYFVKIIWQWYFLPPPDMLSESTAC